MGGGAVSETEKCERCEMRYNRADRVFTVIDRAVTCLFMCPHCSHIVGRMKI